MRILVCIPHVFKPRSGSLYSSECESKRNIKRDALWDATIGNISRHYQTFFVHASLGKNLPIVTRRQHRHKGAEIEVQIYTPPDASLALELPESKYITIHSTALIDYKQVALHASKSLLRQAGDYDLVAYIEDDLLIEDPCFFDKITYLIRSKGEQYAFMPHRCEYIPGKGDVILSGDPDGGRPDLFWDTGEKLMIDWPLGSKEFYRATNPHSGCYFLSREQATTVYEYWEKLGWRFPFELAGPLEQAATGLLLPVLKIMKPIPTDYRFLMVRHRDSLWQRHPMEEALSRNDRVMIF
jgi:hypothetical protein